MSLSDDMANVEDRICTGVTYLSGGKFEYEDWAYKAYVECNDAHGCGFKVEWDDDPDWAVTSDEFALLHAMHLEHARGTKPMRPTKREAIS